MSEGFLYLYGTGERPDGYRFAVGHMPDTTGAPVPRALFVRAADAHTFAYAESARTGIAVHVLHSAELSNEDSILDTAGPDIVSAIRKLVAYNWADEEKDCQQQEHTEHHIYHSLTAIAAWLDRQPA